MNPKILSEEPISMNDLGKELKKIKARDKDASNIRTNKTDEYLNNFLFLKSTEADALKKELTELNIPRLKDQHICKLIDILPETVEEVKVVLSGYTITISNQNYKKIVDAIVKHPIKER